jgi:hypothetical protein
MNLNSPENRPVLPLTVALPPVGEGVHALPVHLAVLPLAADCLALVRGAQDDE